MKKSGDNNADILASFIDILNLYGPDSENVKAYLNDYSNNLDALTLFDIAIQTKKFLESGQLK